ncbi:MAG: succinate dehydrogenase iron-sulfur subunit [Ignavibacteriales bacterium]|nr:succinate dehydrogenase iron-sulfur subunit [Ignavibacteriales bacterium]
MSNIKTFKVFRFDPEKDKKPRFETYKVEWKSGQTVLDGLNYIRDNIDGSLAYRSSCREGVCGSCAMHINGKYCLACEQQLKELSDTITIRPLANLEVIKDLFVDMAPFWKKYKAIKPYLIGKESSTGKERIQSQDERAHLDKVIDCVLCASCYAACGMNAIDPEYLGPAALSKVNRFFLDSRDSAKEERLAMVANDHGVFRCHTMFNCQIVCPKEVDPTANISNLKRNIIASQMSGKLSKKGV